MTGDADPKTDGLIKYVWTVEHRQLIYGDVLFDMSIDSSDAAVLAGYDVDDAGDDGGGGDLIRVSIVVRCVRWRVI